MWGTNEISQAMGNKLISLLSRSAAAGGNGICDWKKLLLLSAVILFQLLHPLSAIKQCRLKSESSWCTSSQTSRSPHKRNVQGKKLWLLEKGLEGFCSIILNLRDHWSLTKSLTLDHVRHQITLLTFFLSFVNFYLFEIISKEKIEGRQFLLKRAGCQLDRQYFLENCSKEHSNNLNN